MSEEEQEGEERSREEGEDPERTCGPLEGLGSCAKMLSCGRLYQRSDLHVNKNYFGSCVKDRLRSKERSRTTSYEAFTEEVLETHTGGEGRWRMVRLLRFTRWAQKSDTWNLTAIKSKTQDKINGDIF